MVIAHNLPMPADPAQDCAPILNAALADENAVIHPVSAQPDGTTPVIDSVKITGRGARLHDARLKVIAPARVTNPEDFNATSGESFRRHVQLLGEGTMASYVEVEGQNEHGEYRGITLEREAAFFMPNTVGGLVWRCKAKRVFGDAVQVRSRGSNPVTANNDSIIGLEIETVGRMGIAWDGVFDYLALGVVVSPNSKARRFRQNGTIIDDYYGVVQRTMFDTEPPTDWRARGTHAETARGRTAYCDVGYLNFMVAGLGGGYVNRQVFDHIYIRQNGISAATVGGTFDDGFRERADFEFHHIVGPHMAGGANFAWGFAYIRKHPETGRGLILHDNYFAAKPGGGKTAGLTVTGVEGLVHENNFYVNYPAVIRDNIGNTDGGKTPPAPPSEILKNENNHLTIPQGEIPGDVLSRLVLPA